MIGLESCTILKFTVLMLVVLALTHVVVDKRFEDREHVLTDLNQRMSSLDQKLDELLAIAKVHPEHSSTV